MNKTLAITAIALVAIVMGLSTIAPVLQQAFAHDVTSPQGGQIGNGDCPDGFQIAVPMSPAGTHPDHNVNGKVCVKIVDTQVIIIDDLSVGIRVG